MCFLICRYQVSMLLCTSQFLQSPRMKSRDTRAFDQVVCANSRPVLRPDSVSLEYVVEEGNARDVESCDGLVVRVEVK
jgi:hypothetical protein